ncbi:hypothetical protein LRS73_35430 (plasmid) [Methylobacterium currus]|uniref:hypothetical protein n=1 Tax=Methylobacterium currus TaxID=2051553 RepID=UPI001E5F1D91|nr:hypothetical protein [Methylobacterium currus]UHC20471.1 hypothetical protein LRS73_35430 [Methylobacterium currus]
MTALAIVTSDDAAWIGSDGASYTEPEGTLRQVVPKVILCPEWECVIGSRGMGGSAEAFRAAAQWSGVADFDGLLARAADLAREADDGLLVLHRGRSVHFTVVLVGYSRARRRFETHTVRTRLGLAWSQDEGRTVEVPPFTVSEVPGLALLPVPPASTAAMIGLRLPVAGEPFSIANPEHFVQLAVLGCRFDEGHRDGDPDGRRFIGVGGFVQLTRLVCHPSPAPEGYPGADRHVIVMDSQITHRWPDVIGEPIQAMSGCLPYWTGEPLPEAPAPQPEEAPAEAAE